MIKIEENINKTKKILEDYQNCKDINTMVELYERLTMYAVFLWENLSELKKDYNMNYYKRKIEISHSFLNNRQEKISERTSLEMANTQNQELIREELESESLVNRLDIFLRQVNKVAEAMRTRISLEKSERNRLIPNEL